MMHVRQIVVAICLMSAVLVGCEKVRTAISKPKKATTRPAVVRATATTTNEEEPASKPAVSYMTVNGKTVVFPLAKLRIDRKGSRVIALLFSDDPKDAIKSNYDGNSFYIEMPLDADDVDDLSSAVWS